MSKHKNLNTIDGQDPARLRQHIDATLALSGSKLRFSGQVESIDQAGTTATIVSGERKFFAFTYQPNHAPLKAGQNVTFRIDGRRAVNVTVEPTPEPVEQTELLTEVLGVLPGSQPEINLEPVVAEDEPTSTMAAAFSRATKFKRKRNQ